MKLCIWPEWELTSKTHRQRLEPMQGMMMLALLAHREVSLELFVEAVYPFNEAGETTQPETWENAIKVRLTHLRRLLRPFWVSNSLQVRLRVAADGA